MPNKDGTLKAKEFVFLCEDRVLATLPGSVPQPERKVMWTILQFHYGEPRIHFEIQPQVARGQVEVGLHFEAAAETNEAWAQLMADHAADLLPALGFEWELEAWTASWRRLHRVYHFEALTHRLAGEVTAEMVRAMMLLQPLVAKGLETIGGGAARMASGRPRREWNRRRGRVRS